MNKLIIVGNGFDLHNGLPTKYSDFLKWFLRNSIECSIKGEDNFCELLKISRSKNHAGSIYFKAIDIDNLVDKFFKINNKQFELDGKLFEFNNDYIRLNIESISPFLMLLISEHYERNWVDIEMLYYKELKDCLYISR